MFATLISLALIAAPALRVAADFSITNPTFTQCGSTDITWNGGKAPYNLVIVNSTDPCGDILADTGDHNHTSMTWKVDFPAGSTLMVSIEDADQEEAWSGAITVGNSEDASCLNNAAASASAPGASATDSTTLPTETVQAAGASVTGGSSAGSDTDGTDGGDGTGPSGALGATSGASALHMNPMMALCALFAAALVL